KRRLLMLLKEVLQPFKHEQIKIKKNKKQTKKARSPVKTLRRMWQYLTRHKVALFIVIFLVFMSSALALAGPFIVGRAIDTFIVNKSVNNIFFVLLLLVFVYIGHSVAIFLQNYLMI